METNRSRSKLVLVAGARPNFMKVASLMRELAGHPRFHPLLVHTGQHYDRAMSRLFFEELGIPRPDHNLEVGSGSHAVQTALVMQRFEPVLEEVRPALVVVAGDVNSTLACSLTAVKLGLPVAHVEAGLRSHDRTMPEEINRVVTDSISELLFTTEQSAGENLLREGIPPRRIHFVGNVMIDTLLRHREKAEDSAILSRLGIAPRSYVLLTLHRPSNVDRRESLESILTALEEVCRDLPVVFPCHPRTREKIREFGLGDRFREGGGGGRAGGIRITEPLGYLDFLKLEALARLVLTDSGGIQEETTVLKVPCVTLRENTERPVTVTEGTNTLAGNSKERVLEKIREALSRDFSRVPAPSLWDGQAGRRIVEVLEGYVA